MAGCLGTKFDLKTLAWVCQMENRDNEAELEQILHQAVDSMLLEKCRLEYNTEGYRFGHERIQQVAYNLIQDDIERNHIHLAIGRRLRYLVKSGAYSELRNADPTNSSSLSSSTTPVPPPPPWLIIAAADQLNHLEYQNKSIRYQDAGSLWQTIVNKCYHNQRYVTIYEITLLSDINCCLF